MFRFFVFFFKLKLLLLLSAAYMNTEPTVHPKQPVNLVHWSILVNPVCLSVCGMCVRPERKIREKSGAPKPRKAPEWALG